MIHFDRAISVVLRNNSRWAKCVLVTGARQVGKSTLLKDVFPDYNYVTFDSNQVITQASADIRLFLRNNGLPLILDEVQLFPDIMREIKMICDGTDERGIIFLTGSQVFELMRLSGESLAGRVSILELEGLSLREIHGVQFNEPFTTTEEYVAAREKCLKPYKDIWRHVFYGGFPELHATQRDREDFYSSYVKTYIERDVFALCAVKDVVAFNRFLAAAAARCGQMLNYSNMAEDVGVSVMTIREWLSLLVRSGMVFLLQPYFSSALKRAVKTPKLYFADTGLAAYVTRWGSPETLANSYVAGNFFENFVVSQIVKSYCNVGKDYRSRLYYLRGKDRDAKGGEREIDLVIDDDGALHPVEIKMSASPRKEMASAFSLLKKEKGKKVAQGAILCQVEKKTYLSDDLVALPLEYI